MMTTAPAYSCLFNFASSWRGGGRKRLEEYARWFDARGGASFIIHQRCADLGDRWGRNRYFVVSRTGWRRLLDDWSYLDAVVEEAGTPALYYAFGIPVYRPVGALNWFHLSNALTLRLRGIPLPLRDKARLWVLGRRTRRHLQNADIVSAESAFSLALLDIRPPQLGYVSVTGSDDELNPPSPAVGPSEPLAIVVGTYEYKALHDSYAVFAMLKAREPALRLVLIGDPVHIPRTLYKRPDVDVTGLLPRAEVTAQLARARYYISTTMIEGAWNAAAEGAYLAEESYISDIPPHRELFQGMSVERVQVPGVAAPLLRVRRSTLSTVNLRSWAQVIEEMLARAGIQTS